MTKDQAVEALGGTQQALAKALGITQGSVSLWGDYPPPLRQLQIEALTGGTLTLNNASTISAGVSQDLVLFFEVPPASLSEGLKLVLPAGSATIEATVL